MTNITTKQDLRNKLFKIEREIRKLKCIGLNKVYQRKLTYMLMWLRMIPNKKKILSNWSMPDAYTLNKMKGDD